MDHDEDYEYSGDTTISQEEAAGMGDNGGEFDENGVYKPKKYTYDPKNETKPNGRVKGRRLIMWHR